MHMDVQILVHQILDQQKLRKKFCLQSVTFAKNKYLYFNKKRT
jgi:hypothetical protein